MKDILEIFDKVKNVEFTTYTECEGLEKELPVFTLNEAFAEEWNKRARINNTKMFVRIYERQPENYQEVLTWVYSLIEDKKENHIAGNEVAFA
jgi:hypothetical protein